MKDPLLLVAGLLGAAGVALGAFGAHGLRQQLGEAIATWQTAVLYHLLHALAILAVVVLARLLSEAALVRTAGWAFALGILLFSGSLYALALGGPRWLGPVTPLGGVAFIAGWLLLAWAALQQDGAA